MITGVIETDGIEESGLWLSTHFYDAGRQETDAAAEPVAFRKRGWKFLLAEAGEVEGIESFSLVEPCFCSRSWTSWSVWRFYDNAAIWLGNPHGYSISQRIVALFDAATPAFFSTGLERFTFEPASTVKCPVALS